MSRFALQGVVAIALAACNPSPNSDAGDGGQDAHDAAVVDMGAPDQMTIEPDVAMVDATGADAVESDAADAGDICPPDASLPVPPLRYVTEIQLSIARNRSGARVVTLNVNPTTMRRPATRVIGDCELRDRTAVTPELVNHGTLTVEQGSLRVEVPWDVDLMRYVSEGSSLIGLRGDAPVTFSFPSMPIAAGMATLTPIEPVALDMRPFTGTYTDPVMPVLVRGRDMVITWTPRPEPDVAAVFSMNSATDRRWLVMCAVPACRGSMTVPADFISIWNVGTEVKTLPGFMRRAEMGPDGRMPPVAISVSGDAVHSAIVVD